MQRITFLLSSPDAMEVVLIFLCSLLAPTVLASGKYPSGSWPFGTYSWGGGAVSQILHV